jgi:hypothetical protein
MFGVLFLLLLLLLLAGLAALCRWLWWSLRPVQQAEVERFARCSDLPVSVENGGRIVQAIARTRFWRAMGVTTAVLLSLFFTIWTAFHSNQLTFKLVLLLVVLAGYYSGSVIAEYRTAHEEYGQVLRVASLRPRLLSDYIDRWAQRWPRTLAFAGMVFALISLVAAGRINWGLAAGVGALAVALVTAVVARHIVERPSALESAELMATDSAIRSRSLHALCGATIGIQIWLVSIALIDALSSVAVRAGVPSNGPLLVLALIVFGVVVPIRGMFIGRNFMRRRFAVRALDAVAP